MSIKTRQGLDAGLKAKFAPEAFAQEATVAELAAVLSNR